MKTTQKMLALSYDKQNEPLALFLDYHHAEGFAKRLGTVKFDISPVLVTIESWSPADPVPNQESGNQK